MNALQKQLGHADLATTAIYVAHHTLSIPHTHQGEADMAHADFPHDHDPTLVSVLSLLSADAAQDIAPALETLFRHVPYAAALLLSDLLLEPVDSGSAALRRSL